MLNENILNEMEQRPSEKTGKFLKRQQMAKNTIRQINALEVHLGHLLADEEYRGKVGSSLNESRTNTTRETKEGIQTIA